MAIQIYDSMTKKKHNFETIEKGHVRMYCCGPTVYDLLHVGNFRGAIFYNFLRNWLEYRGYKVTYVYNYTDVDDKIIDRANADKVSSSEISEKYIKEFQADYSRLGLRPQTHNPKVTQYMEPIIKMIEELINRDKAYVVDGEVLYSVRSFSDYGKLSRQSPDDLRSGTRVEIGEKKRDPLDFALWKPSKPGEPSWKSPWGLGRPGWHIECSAMASSILGDQIDIHGGGLDLLFPHHENELAQSEGCSGKSYVRYWVHNNMINFSGTKMSKSLGNVMTARSFMDQYSPEILKYLMLSSHYRTVSEFGNESIDHAIHGLARVYSALALADSFLVNAKEPISEDPGFKKVIDQAWVQAENSFDNDFSTPEGFAALFEVVRAFNTQVKRGVKENPAIVAKCRQFKKFVVDQFGSMFALFQEPAKEFLISLDDKILEKANLKRQDIDQIVNARALARKNKDFAKSDELRDQLTKMGISVSDTQEGSFWEVTK